MEMSERHSSSTKIMTGAQYDLAQLKEINLN